MFFIFKPQLLKQGWFSGQKITFTAAMQIMLAKNDVVVVKQRGMLKTTPCNRPGGTFAAMRLNPCAHCGLGCS